MDGLDATPDALSRQGIAVNRDGVRRSAFDLLRQPEVTWAQLAAVWPELLDFAPAVTEQLEIEGRYAGYLKRQEADIEAFRRDESLAIPADIDFDRIGGLSTEIRTKLAQARPATLGAAGRIPGVTPAALVALLGHVRRPDPPGPPEPKQEARGPKPMAQYRPRDFAAAVGCFT